MSEKPNDSPAFRLRPRAEPKSYYSIRLEYSANPAAFTRERPRSSGIKKRTTATKSYYSRSKQQSNKLAAATQSVLRHDNYASVPLHPVKLENVVSKEDIEREERRKLLKREISQSITTNTIVSPFMQRLSIDDLRPTTVYDQNYIRLKIEAIISKQQAGVQSNAHIVCRCSKISSDDDDDCDDVEDNKTSTFINVHLYDEYADETLLKTGKIINIAKFKTGPDTPTGNNTGESGGNIRWVHFDVIVRYDDCVSAELSPSFSLSSVIGSSSAIDSAATSRKTTLIPFVSITDMIDKPIEPFVEMAPPSPLSLPNKDQTDQE